MTEIKLCGLKRPQDIEYVNELVPEYIGFVFAKGSRRYVSPKEAAGLRKNLNTGIIPVGVFADENKEIVADLVNGHIIDIVQLHGNEDDEYISSLRNISDCKIIKALRIMGRDDIIAANKSTADYVLLDSGGGSGEAFDWSLIQEIQRPYFLAGGLNPSNVERAITELQPFAVDASSSLETDGFKDKDKMAAFVNAVRYRKD